jgi:heme/copper-type cytochrome/quinol oxidase subunit 2
MRRLWTKIVGLALTGLLLSPVIAAAAGGKAAPLAIVADTRKLHGWMRWWAALYNESHAYFTLVTIIIIPVIGLIFGLLADFVMKHIGIDLKSRELTEH